MPAGGNPYPMAKGYPIRPEAPDAPECHECGSLRLGQDNHGVRKCLDCGAKLVADPFEALLS